MSTTEFRLKTYYDLEYVLDTDEAPTIPIRVRRFSVHELEAFMMGYDRLANPPSERVFYRRPDGDEQEQVTTATGRTEYRVGEAEVRRRRLEEMTPEQRTAYHAQRQADETFAIQFCAEAITQHVWLPPGVVIKVEDDDGNERLARKGVELAQVFAGNLSTLQGLVRAVFEANALSGEQKKRLRWRPNSTDSSNLRLVPGPRPGASADDVEPPGSATSAPVMDIPVAIRSGSHET